MLYPEALALGGHPAPDLSSRQAFGFEALLDVGVDLPLVALARILTPP